MNWDFHISEGKGRFYIHSSYYGDRPSALPTEKLLYQSTKGELFRLDPHRCSPFRTTLHHPSRDSLNAWA
ncbi:hypothetical protein BCY86_08445 [Pajaroellobacter abortibovis]|uniref:Uncharacterized protein n=1 Tax=Pajaroellobacter abortibovis TaxID=1882918 RepID=A0A1L6MYU3_9BACT|nr:hypothetical protein BCY86_08445 [Pajaroellobacter abortibovis]